MHALALAWSYFPHSWGIRCGDKRTPIEAFEDDKVFQKAILNSLKQHIQVAPFASQPDTQESALS